MIERYTKAGAAVRFERSGDHRALLRIVERGWAETAGERFSAGSGSPLAVPLLAEGRVELEAQAAAIESRIPASLDIDRLTLTDGVASHEVSTSGARRVWSDAQARLHVTLVNRAARARAFVDLGSAGGDPIDGRPIAHAAGALANVRPVRDEAVAPLRLEPAVAAALLAALAPLPALAGDARIEQHPFERLPFDGSGNRIDRVPSPVDDWPNTYRPSYRIAPKTMPLHVRLAGAFGTPSGAPPFTAVALAAAPAVTRDGVALQMIVACEDGSARVVGVHETAKGWLDRITAAGPPVAWFPAGAGVFGCVIDLADVTMEPA